MTAYIFGLSLEAKAAISHGLGNITQAYELDALPTSIKDIVDLCYVATVTEFINLHYMFGYDLEEYFYYRDMGHFDEYIEMVLGDDMAYNEYVTKLDLLVCDGNVLANLLERPDKVLTDPNDIPVYDQHDIFENLSILLQRIIKDTLRDLDILSYLPTKESMVEIVKSELSDVSVYLRTSKIIVE